MKKESDVPTETPKEYTMQDFLQEYELLCNKAGWALEAIPFDTLNAEIKPKLRPVRYVPSKQQE